MKLHVPKGNNRWCGPSAVAIIAGCTTDEAAAIIRKEFGRKQVTRTHAREVGRALTHYGLYIGLVYDYSNLTSTKRPTLAAWLKESRKRRVAGMLWLVDAGCHWQVVSGRKFIDGIVKEPISIRDKRAGRRRRVKKVYAVMKKH